MCGPRLISKVASRATLVSFSFALSALESVCCLRAMRASCDASPCVRSGCRQRGVLVEEAQNFITRPIGNPQRRPLNPGIAEFGKRRFVRRGAEYVDQKRFVVASRG